VRVVGARRILCALTSALTMPVGAASVPQPTSIICEARIRPRSALGAVSPKLTVVIVVMAQ
jgi:hypothetical protein